VFWERSNQSVRRSVDPGGLRDGVCLTHDERVRFNELAKSLRTVDAPESPAVVLQIPASGDQPRKTSWWRRRWRRSRGLPDVW
jgi:hypothetical protein